MKANSIRTGAAGFCLCLGLIALHAQQASTVPSVTFKQGKVLIPQEGKTAEATNDVVLPGEILVKTNGVFTLKKGKERQLVEGQTITADGMLTSPDGSVVPVADHLVMKLGRVQIVRDGEATPLTGVFVLPDGSHIMPDGSIRTRNGLLRRMLDGQLLKLDGSALPATDTVSRQGGKVMLYKDGGRVELRPDQFMAMSDGTRVGGDGTVIRSDGTKVTLREGEILKIPGV